MPSVTKRRRLGCFMFTDTASTDICSLKLRETGDIFDLGLLRELEARGRESERRQGEKEVRRGRGVKPV